MGHQDIDSKVTGTVTKHIKDSGVTIVWLCGATGIPRATLTRRLSGHSSFTVNELQRIAAALRISPTDLFVQAVSA